MLTIYRDGLTIRMDGPLEPAEGSYNVPVKLESEADKYSNYSCDMFIGYYVKGIRKTVKAKTNDQGQYLIPDVAFAQDGPIFIAFRFEDAEKNEGYTTNALMYLVAGAPVVHVDAPIDPTWEELVKEWIKDIIGNADVDIDLSAYSTTEESDKKYAPKEHTHDEYLTQHQSLSAYSTTAQSDEKYQPKGSYASATHEHDEYATQTQFNNLSEEKADQTTLNSHINDTTKHITSAERTTWNAKSNFSGSYNDLTNKPTIPTVPTSLKNPYALTIALGSDTYTYDGSKAISITIEDGNEVDY